MQLDGIPISDEQCIGESLPILNTSFQTLCAFANNSYSNISSLNDRVDILEGAVSRSDKILNSQLRISNYGAIGIGLPPEGSEFLRVAGPVKFDGSLVVAETSVTGPTNLNTLTVNSSLTLRGNAFLGEGSSQNLTVNSKSTFNQNVGIKTEPDASAALKVNGTAVFNTISAGNFLGLSNANISFNGITELKANGDIAVSSNTAGIGYRISPNTVTAVRVNNYSNTGLLNYEVTTHSNCGTIQMPQAAYVGNTPFFVNVINNTIKETDVIITNVKTSSLTFVTAHVVNVSNGSFKFVLQSTGSSIGSGDSYPRITINFARVTTV